MTRNVVSSNIVVLKCDCGLPYAEVRDGVLRVVSRHHGERHTNDIAIARLAEIGHEEALAALLRKVLTPPPGKAGVEGEEQ